MRLSSVSQHLLVFISVLPLVLSFDPCFNFTVLDESRRSTSNVDPNRLPSKTFCDYHIPWNGWYRLFINGQSTQMAVSSAPLYSCGSYYALVLVGGHPTVQDGVVSRTVCGSSGNGCAFVSNSITVKACSGGYYVYAFVRPVGCIEAYCADASFITVPPVSTTPAPGIFYPFGSAAFDTINPTSDEGSSSAITLLSPFQFFGRTYQQIYVNNNGFLTFNQASSQFAPNSFPANGSQDVIAGLWTNIDNSARGVVSYNQYTSGSVLASATQDINNYFPNLTFTASWVFVATWDKVAYYPVTDTKTSFQMVLISDSSNSFVLMNYGDIAVAGQQVEAGYDTINSTNYIVIPGSNNGISISNLQNSSNVNDPGRWVFRVDGGPETNRENVVGLQADLVSFLDLTESANMQIVLQQIKQELVKKGLPSNINLELRKIKKINP